ncbi:hypothetical protein NE237_010881 [Protea cynaroides]|uniref:Uncharacterized protein n=1 Tax=Protea cynaroides TaxID=273540 RepID=A0A9Q0L137_9MAGN|nr:hypothetical protein NE237_010881 [Protea cynaroides]
MRRCVWTRLEEATIKLSSPAFFLTLKNLPLCYWTPLKFPRAMWFSSSLSYIVVEGYFITIPQWIQSWNFFRQSKQEAMQHFGKVTLSFWHIWKAFL